MVALALVGAPQALAGPGPCTEFGGTATCNGNQSQGIASGVDFDPSNTILNANVSGNIAPAVDTNGILFSGDTTVEINSYASNIFIDGYGDGVLGTAPGNVEINHIGNIWDAFRGINGHSLNGNVDITAYGRIDDAVEAAINAYAPNGSVSIWYAGRITDAENRGISGVAATVSGTGTVSITSYANIEAYNQAIYGLSVGGTTIQSFGNLYSESSRGISAEATGGNATIEQMGYVNSWDTSLYARSTGGNASVTSYGGVWSRGNNGIVAESTVGTATIFSRGNVWAANQGLFANGLLGASIDSIGNVNTGATGNDAVFAFSQNGPVSVSSIGNIYTPNGRGVVAINSNNAGAATIYSVGKVTAKGDGVYAQGMSASVEQYGDVSSALANGISAYGSSGGASVTGWGDVSAYVNGITAQTGGTANATIDHKGDVTALGGHGVRAQASNGNASVEQTGDVWARTIGVAAVTNTGNASAYVKGDVYSEFATGIEAGSFGGGTASISGMGEVDAFTHGLLANAFGGAASIDFSGGVTSRMGTAVEANSFSGNVTINRVGDTTGHLFGIKAISNAAGAVVSVTSKGDVFAAEGTGIHAQATGTGGTASVNSTGDVFADHFFDVDHFEGSNGIFVLADGNASATSKGDVTSVELDAIWVRSLTGTASIVSEGAINAGNQGLFAFGRTGASIDSNGSVTAENDAIFAFANGGSDPANVSVTSVGDVTSTLARGIVAMTSNGGNAIIMSTGKVDAAVEAITAFTFGNGNASVTQTGDVNSDTSTGVKAHVGGDGDATIVVDGKVTTQVEGVTATVTGSGNAMITQTGDVTSTDASAIVAQVFANGNATINSKGDVQAQTQGVSAFVGGNGNASVTHTGDVNSEFAFGIRADVNGNGNASIDAKGDVEAKMDAVTAKVGGNGDAEVKFAGNATSNESTGLSAIVDGTGNAMIDASGTVHSQLEALLAVAGTGNATIKYKGTITSDDFYGANAVAGDGNVLVDISGGDINSGLYGIQGVAGGNNHTVDITFAGGDITTDSRGIYGEALGTGSTVTINSTGDVTSPDVAIFANANGNANITSVGDIDTTSGLGRGIFAWSHAGAASISSVGMVDTKDTSLIALGLTGASINSNGDVTSANSRGIDAQSANGLASIISVGDITSPDVSLFALGGAGATINSTGKIVTANADAIYAQTFGAGNVSIMSRGEVVATNSRGITGINNSGGLGSVLIDTVGKVTANDTAITAYTQHGNATVYSTGDVSSTVNQGIQAQSQNDGYALIDSKGDVTSENVGLIAMANSGNATIYQDGNVTTNHTGLEALSQGGDAIIEAWGIVDVRLEGLKAIASGSSGSSSIAQWGNVTSDDSFGINSIAWGNGGSAKIEVVGDVDAQQTALQALAFGTNALAWVKSDGKIDSEVSNGIQAQATGAGSKATIDAKGDVDSMFIGVFGIADSDVVIDYVGNATSTISDAILGQSFNGAVTIRSTGNQTGGGVRHGIFALGSGLVDVTSVGDVTTTSEYRAIHGQSNNGDVKLDVTGHVYVNGADGDSDAIFAFAANGKADVIIREGSLITGGSDPLASFGVEFGSATGTNTLTNWGEINDANGGKTIGGDTAADVVLNYNLVDGDFYLAGGANRFDNLPGGWTYFKAFSSVGAGNDYNNTGAVSPFGPMVIGTSVLEGDFHQTDMGRFWADLDFDTGVADLLDVTGDVTAGGDVVVYITNLGTNVGPIPTTTIINSNGAVTDAGITGVDQGPLIVDVSTTATTVDINVAIDFGVGGGLSNYSQPVGDFLQNLFETTLPGGLTPEQEAYYLGLINIGDTEAYDDFLSVPAATAASLTQVFEGARAFADNLFSCRQRDGTYRMIAEGRCVWAAGGLRSFDQGETMSTVGFNDRAASLSGGGQMNVDANWAVGFGGGYETGSSSTSADLDLTRSIISGGLVAKGTFGNAQFAAAVTGGGGTVDSERVVTFPVAGTVTGQRSIGYIGVTGRAAYVKDMGSFYVKPMLEGAATYIAAGAYTESGAGVGDYDFAAINQLIGRGTATVELGTEFASGDILFRPYISAGATVLGGQNIDVVAGLPGLGPGTFTTTASSDAFYGDIRAGIYAFGGTGWSTRLEYDGRFSANSSSHSGSLKFNLPF